MIGLAAVIGLLRVSEEGELEGETVTVGAPPSDIHLPVSE